MYACMSTLDILYLHTYYTWTIYIYKLYNIELYVYDNYNIYNVHSYASTYVELRGAGNMRISQLNVGLRENSSQPT